jgi:hypothetical protein
LDRKRGIVKFRQAINSPDKAHWLNAATDELNRLINSTQSMSFIDPRCKPSDRIASYYNPQCQIKIKEGKQIYRVRGTYGGNRTDYVGDTAAWTADLETVKVLLNAVVSENSNWMTIDIKDFYLGTPMEREEYMWIDRAQLTDTILTQYADSIHFANNRAMVKIVKGIYGLPHAGKIAQERLIALLYEHGFNQSTNTACLFTHASKNIAFTLVVDDFGVKYKHDSDAEYLLSTLRKLYDVTTDTEGSRYLGMHIKRDRLAGTLSLSMPGYVSQALDRLHVIKGDKPTVSPSIYQAPKYGRKVQYSSNDESDPLPSDKVKFIQRVCGIFLYYARAVDPTMLTAILKISSSQARPTVSVDESVQQFLQYAAHNPDASITYYKSDMRLIVHSDASYLSESESRSRAGGCFFLSNNGDPTTSPLNGTILCVSTILPTVCSSSHEAEYAALFINGQHAEQLRATLLDLGYPQSPTPIIGDNETSIGVATGSKRIRRSQSMDMRYNWIKDRASMNHFHLIWHPGKLNFADYFTKIHPKILYPSVRSRYVS